MATYIAGVGLVSGLGPDLPAAIGNINDPPPLQTRAIQGLDYPVPFFAIADTESDWHRRCANLMRQAIAESGARDRTGALYLASSSCNVGAMEAGQPHAESVSDFLADVAKMTDWEGPVLWINSACTSSNNAILAAQEAIEAGRFHEAVVLGLELENRLTMAGFAGMQLLARDRPRPFQTGRDGLVLGEAVAALRITRRPSRWRIVAGVQVVDSTHVSGASIASYVAMLGKVMKLAALHPEQIDIVKVQAAGSPANDAVEARALTQFFQVMPALVTFKSLIGHTLGASGAAEIALLLTLLERQQWPRLNLGENECDAELGVNFAPSAPPVRFLIACNLGFGGSHSCTVLEDCHAR